MNTKIILSLAIIGAVAAIAVGGTVAYFTDTETSTGNTFTAGTIDIAIDGQNPWTSHYSVGDLKPGETGNINFDITNVGANPVNVSKNLTNWNSNTGSTGYTCPAKNQYPGGDVSSEPECVKAQENGLDKNDVQSWIEYDLYVEVYDATGTKIWWQQIFNPDENKSLTDVYGTSGDQYVALGMIPVGGHMLVKQSYHFDYSAGNEYQGDTLSFDMNIRGEQLTGQDAMASVVLENKRIGEPQWDIIQGDAFTGILSYKTQGPLFTYNFSGVAPLASHNYVLAVGYNANTDVDTQIGTGTTDGTGNISISGSFDTGSLTNAKAWLVPAENWSGGMVWTGWPASVSNFLWETGLINYIKN
ncbi:MAG: TasA family protein [Candidatus Pacebacteria bacterium]|nr:TasA family protein [Candidatus Paceibacterota bacterium]